MWGYLRDVIGRFEAKDLITLFIAAYGALLSTFVFIQAMRKERRRIVIQHTLAFYGYPGGEAGPTMASLEVINKGHRPVVVSAPGMQTPKRRQLVFINADGFRDFPKRLDDGESAAVRVPYEDIAKALKKEGYSGIVVLRPVCTDSTGKKYRGKKLKLDVDIDWAQYR